MEENVEAVTLTGAIQAFLSVCRPGSASLGSCWPKGDGTSSGRVAED